MKLSGQITSNPIIMKALFETWNTFLLIVFYLTTSEIKPQPQPWLDVSPDGMQFRARLFLTLELCPSLICYWFTAPCNSTETLTYSWLPITGTLNTQGSGLSSNIHSFVVSYQSFRLYSNHYWEISNANGYGSRGGGISIASPKWTYIVLLVHFS